MAKFGLKKGVNVTRVVSKIAATVLALYVGGTIINEFGLVMNCTSSAFYPGLTLIGWTVGTVTSPNTTGICNETSGMAATISSYPNTISDVSGAGVLAVIGLIGIGSVVMEFVSFSL